MTTPAPRSAYVVAVTAALSLCLSLGIAWYVHLGDLADDHRRCLRAVDVRNDNRAMWLYVIEINQADRDGTARQRARYDAFVVELDKRLPVLTCSADNSVPTEADTGG